MSRFNLRKRSQQEGLWISPTGERIPVIEHLQEIQKNPETFNLDQQDVDITGLTPEMAVAKLGNIALGLIRNGWIRYRMFDIVHHFEVGNLNNSRTKKMVLEILSENVSWPDGERVEINNASTNYSMQETVKQFMLTASTAKYPSDAHKNWSLSYKFGGVKTGL